MQNICSIRAHSTPPLPVDSAQSQCSTLGAANCSTGGLMMSSCAPTRASHDRAICPSSIVLSNDESCTGHGAILNREDTQHNRSSCPESFSLSRPDLSARSILSLSVDLALEESTDLRKRPSNVSVSGTESCMLGSPVFHTSPVCNGPNAPVGPNFSTFRSATPKVDLPKKPLVDLSCAIPWITSTTAASSTDLVQQTGGTSSMGCASCVKTEVLMEPPPQERICARNGDGTSSVPAQFDHLRNFSMKEIGPMSLGNRTVECTSEILVPGAGRNSSRACKLCGTTKTPLWRSGPHGPKSLCNACGIRYKKSRRSLVASECPGEESSPAAPTSMPPVRTLKRKLGSASEVKVNKVTKYPLERNRWPALMVVQRDIRVTAEDTESSVSSAATLCSSRIPQKASLCRRASSSKLALLVKQSRCTRVYAKDEEEAAILLMALSCGLVLA